VQDINKAAAEMEKVLIEGMYLAVGLAILGFQRAQVLRVELTRQLEAQLEPYEGYLATAREQAESQVQALRTQLADLARGAGLG
jgi:hypothetical protein